MKSCVHVKYIFPTNGVLKSLLSIFRMAWDIMIRFFYGNFTPLGRQTLYYKFDIWESHSSTTNHKNQCINTALLSKEVNSQRLQHYALARKDGCRKCAIPSLLFTAEIIKYAQYCTHILAKPSVYADLRQYTHICSIRLQLERWLWSAICLQVFLSHTL